jgi:P27 family predicted phage terminase small subunit
MLEGACRAYDRAVEADLIVQRDGLIMEEVTEKGDVRIKKHPAVEISNRSWLLVKSFCSEFGLSPVSRVRLAVQVKEEEDDLAALLAAPRHAGQSPRVQ